MTLETPRLSLIPCEPAHILALIELPDRFQALMGYPATVGLREMFTSGEVSSEWLASLRALEGTDPWVFGFWIIERASGAAVGSAGFKGPPDGNGAVEIAYGVAPQFEGRGYASEAAAALVAFAFDADAVRIVLAHTLPTGLASQRVLTKCGFRHVGEVVDPDDGLVWRWERLRQET